MRTSENAKRSVTNSKCWPDKNESPSVRTWSQSWVSELLLERKRNVNSGHTHLYTEIWSSCERNVEHQCNRVRIDLYILCLSLGLLLASSVRVLPALHGPALLAHQRELQGSGSAGWRGQRAGLSQTVSVYPLWLRIRFTAASCFCLSSQKNHTKWRSKGFRKLWQLLISAQSVSPHQAKTNT